MKNTMMVCVCTCAYMYAPDVRMYVSTVPMGTGGVVCSKTMTISVARPSNAALYHIDTHTDHYILTC